MRPDESSRDPVRKLRADLAWTTKEERIDDLERSAVLPRSQYGGCQAKLNENEFRISIHEVGDQVSAPPFANRAISSDRGPGKMSRT